MANDKFQGRMHGPQAEAPKEGKLMRLVYMVLIWFMIQISMTILGALTLLQFVLMLLNKGEANAQLADVGESLGIWVAKAARFLVAASDVKPWPWTELD